MQKKNKFYVTISMYDTTESKYLPDTKLLKSSKASTINCK